MTAWLETQWALEAAAAEETGVGMPWAAGEGDGEGEGLGEEDEAFRAQEIEAYADLYYTHHHHT